MNIAAMRVACIVALGTVASLSGTSARAQIFLDMAVTPAVQGGAPGSVQFWDVALANHAGEDATIRLTAFVPGLLEPGVEIAANALPGSAFLLASGETRLLSHFFSTTVLPGATPGSYDGLAEFLYDATDSSGVEFLDLGASADWRLDIAAASAPEPSGLPLLAVGLVRFLRRRRVVSAPPYRRTPRANVCCARASTGARATGSFRYASGSRRSFWRKRRWRSTGRSPNPGSKTAASSSSPTATGTGACC